MRQNDRAPHHPDRRTGRRVPAHARSRSRDDAWRSAVGNSAEGRVCRFYSEDRIAVGDSRIIAQAPRPHADTPATHMSDKRLNIASWIACPIAQCRYAFVAFLVRIAT